MKKSVAGIALEGVLTFAVGLTLRLFAEDIDTPVITLTKVGVVLMCVGGCLSLTALYRLVRPGSGN